MDGVNETLESTPTPATLNTAALNTGAQLAGYPGRAVINLAAIRHNVATMTTRVHEHSPHTAVMAVVKGGAYGHGLLESARASVQGGATWLGTAQACEAIELREAGFTERILTWLHAPGANYHALIERDIDVSVAHPGAVAEVARAAREAGKPARVHLKVDTGLGRNGYTLAHIDEVIEPLIAAQNAGDVEFVGIWSHFAFADEPDHPTVLAQADVFDQAIARAERAGAHLEVRHIANSAATLTNPRMYYDLVRPGLAIYGLDPAPGLGSLEEFGLVPAMRLEAHIATVKQLPAGHGVSYGHHYTTTSGQEMQSSATPEAQSQETTVAIVPLGYADGIPRHASGHSASGGLGASVAVGGRIVRIAGRVCMDQFVVDLGPEADVQAGDVAVLFGDARRGEPTAEDWAVAAETISYEIITRIGERVPRHYIDEPVS